MINLYQSVVGNKLKIKSLINPPQPQPFLYRVVPLVTARWFELNDIPGELWDDMGDSEDCWKARGRSSKEMATLLKSFKPKDEWFGLEFETSFQQDEYRILTSFADIRWSPEYIINVKDDWVYVWMKIQFKTMTDQVAAMLMR